MPSPAEVTRRAARVCTTQRESFLDLALVGSLFVVGALAFAIVEGWSAVDAAYFAFSTISTIGYGDVSPASTAGRLMDVVYMLLCLVVQGYVFRVSSRAVKRALAADLREFRVGARTTQPTDSPLLFCLVTLGVALLTGFLFAAVENWAIIDAMLFAAASISTIGYGNDHPTTTAGRLLIVPIGTLGFFSMTYTLVTTQRQVTNRMEAEERHRAAVADAELVGGSGAGDGAGDDRRTLRSTWRLVVAASAAAIVFVAGTLIFFFLVAEWTVLDAMYFSAITLSTVGLGDVVPDAPFVRAVLVLYICLGMASVGYLIATIGAAAAVRNSKRKEHVALAATLSPAHLQAVYGNYVDGGDDFGSSSHSGTLSDGDDRAGHSGGKAVTPSADPTWVSLASPAQGLGTSAGANVGEAEAARRLRRRRTAQWDAGMLALLAALTVAMSSAAFSLLESWSFVDALYFSVALLTTVGYGDLAPDSAGGRFFATIFSFVAIGLMSYALALIQEASANKSRSDAIRAASAALAEDGHVPVEMRTLSEQQLPPGATGREKYGHRDLSLSSLSSDEFVVSDVPSLLDF